MRVPSLPRTCTLLLALGLAGSAFADEAPATNEPNRFVIAGAPHALTAEHLVIAGAPHALTTERRVEVRQFAFGHDGAEAPHALVMLRTVADGDAEAHSELRLLGTDAESIDLDEMAVGSTRSIPLGDGRWMDVTREESSLRLLIDDDEIEIPLGGEDGILAHALPSGLPDGAKVIVMKAGEMHVGDGAPHVMFLDESGEATELDGEGLAWFGGQGHGSVQGHVVFAGEDSGHHGVHHGAHHGPMMLALPKLLAAAGSDFEGLETLEGLEPEVREKVVEALRELLGGPLTLEIDVEAIDLGEGEDQQVTVRRVPTVKRIQVQ